MVVYKNMLHVFLGSLIKLIKSTVEVWKREICYLLAEFCLLFCIMSRLKQRLTLPLVDEDVIVDQGPGSANSTSLLIPPDFGDQITYSYLNSITSITTRDTTSRDTTRDTTSRDMFPPPRGSLLPVLADGAGTRKNLMYNEYENFMKNSVPMSE